LFTPDLLLLEEHRGEPEGKRGIKATSAELAPRVGRVLQHPREDSQFRLPATESTILGKIDPVVHDLRVERLSRCGGGRRQRRTQVENSKREGDTSAFDL